MAETVTLYMDATADMDPRNAYASASPGPMQAGIPRYAIQVDLGTKDYAKEAKGASPTGNGPPGIYQLYLDWWTGCDLTRLDAVATPPDPPSPLPAGWTRCLIEVSMPDPYGATEYRRVVASVVG